MAEKSDLVKKEIVLYALLIGLVIGFLAGAVLAVYKLTPATSQGTPVQQQQVQEQNNSDQLQQQTAEAITSFEAEVTANPNNVSAWTQLGHLYYDSGQVDKAIKAYKRSLELQPGNADVLTDMGVMYRRNKQPEKAIEAFEKAYAANPKHEPSRLNKGIVLLYDFKDTAGAIAVWEELLVINPQAKLNNGMPLPQAIKEIKTEM